jgi:hypothetical protein
MRRFLIAALAALGFLVPDFAFAQAHTVKLAWTAPSARVDGSALALTAIADFKVYDTSIAVPGAPGQLITTMAGPFTVAAQTFTTGTVPAGTHTYVVVTDTTDGLTSAVSNVASAVVPNAAAAAITNLTATVQ